MLGVELAMEKLGLLDTDKPVYPSLNDHAGTTDDPLMDLNEIKHRSAIDEVFGVADRTTGGDDGRTDFFPTAPGPGSFV